MTEIVRRIFDRKRALKGEIIDPGTPRTVRLTSAQADEMLASGEMNSLFRELPAGSHVVCEEQGVDISIPDHPTREKPPDIINGQSHPVQKDPSRLISSLK